MIRSLASSGRIKTETYPIVVKSIVPAADRSTDFVRFNIEAVKGEVEVPVVIGNVNLGALLQLFAVKRVVGNPISERQCGFVPDFIVKTSVI
jgi:hypothetical protein